MPQPSRFSLLPAVSLSAFLMLAPGLAAQEPIVLYTQDGPPSGNGIPDQDFEPEFDVFDSHAADDFEVTGEHGWDIMLVRTVGTTDGHSFGKVNLKFYENSPGGGSSDLPGAVVCSYDQLDSTTFPSLEVALPTPCKLPQGRYWLGVQVDQNYEEHGQHFWSNTRIQHGSEAVWSNPLGGFERDCPSFRPQTQCLVGGANNPDLIFRLEGQLTPPPTTDLLLELAGVLPPSSFMVRYDLRVTNHGPLDATGVEVGHSLPEGCAFERDSCGGQAGEGWRWPLGSLASGASADCQIVCDIGATPAGQRLLATATVVADQPVTNPATTSAQVEVITGPVPVIPVAGPAGLATLAALLALAGAALLRRP
jgi:uncharacterized repeat protein (TIGR01451 family)